MSNLRIVYDNFLDVATLSAVPAMVATLDVDNLKTVCRSSVSRTTSTAAQAIKGNFPQNQIVSSFVLWRHNLTANATIRLRLYSLDNQAGNLLYDSTAIAPYDTKTLGDLNWGVDPLDSSVFLTWGVFWSVLWFSSVVAKSFIIDVVDTNNPDGYLQFSRGILGPYITPTRNPAYGLSLGWDEEVVQERTDGGTVHTDPATPYRTLEFNLRDIDESIRPQFLEMMRQVGRRKEFFISVYPEIGGEKERDHSMLGKFSSFSPLSHPYFSSYSQSLKIVEA